MTSREEDGRTRSLRVAFLLPRLDVGGAERVVLRTAAGLNRQRFDPVVVGLTAGSNEALTDELDASGVPYVVLGTARERLRPLWRLVHWLRSSRCDALVTMMFHANLVGRLLRDAGRVPVLVNSERVVGWEPLPRRLLNRLTAFRADAITTNSRAGQAFWAAQLRLPIDAIRVVPNGVDTAVFRPAAEEPMRRPAIGNLARLHAKNDHATLLHALALLRRRGDLGPWRLIVGGEGPERSRLEAMATELGIGDVVEFAGHTRAPHLFLQGLDVYVQSSVAEGMSNAVLEAMATGLPVVATNVGGTPELLAGGAGILVPPRQPEALADALGRLLVDTARRRSIGAAARAVVEHHYSLTAMVSATDALLVDLARGLRP